MHGADRSAGTITQVFNHVSGHNTQFLEVTAGIIKGEIPAAGSGRARQGVRQAAPFDKIHVSLIKIVFHTRSMADHFQCFLIYLLHNRYRAVRNIPDQVVGADSPHIEVFASVGEQGRIIIPGMGAA